MHAPDHEDKYVYILKLSIKTCPDKYVYIPQTCLFGES